LLLLVEEVVLLLAREEEDLSIDYACVRKGSFLEEREKREGGEEEGGRKERSGVEVGRERSQLAKF